MRRDGMANLIDQLRQMGSAEREEFTLAGETYWADEHLQTLLDQQCNNIFREVILPVPTYTNNVVQYFDYFWHFPNIEEASSGTEAFKLENALGQVVDASLYTINYDAQHIRFLASTTGEIMWLTYRSYNVARAASSCWLKKAANVANRFDVKTDNHQLTRSQLQKQYLAMADYYKRQGGGRAKQMQRSDMHG